MALSDWEVRREKTGATILYTKHETGSGIRIGLNKGKRTLDISGWFDHMVGIQGGVISLEELESLFNKTPRQSKLVHSKNCPKVEHIGAGYLHAEGSDAPYDVDGVMYCGRCHEVLPEEHK